MTSTRDATGAAGPAAQDLHGRVAPVTDASSGTEWTGADPASPTGPQP